MKAYIKFFTIIASAVLLSIISLVSSEIELKSIKDSVVSEVHSSVVRMLKMRCTRRFSPGVCMDNVVSVWTFEFLKQNCTERLGCPNNYRSNRFRSYKMCMKRCHGLVDIYLNMLQLEEKMEDTNDAISQIMRNETEDRNLREGYARPRYTSFLPDIVDPSQEEEEEEYKSGDEDTRFVVYKDSSIHEDIMPVDVDSVHGEFRSEVMIEW